MSEQVKCELCGEPMPEGEEMFKYHGYSGSCPKPPVGLPTPPAETAKCKHCGNPEQIILDAPHHDDLFDHKFEPTPPAEKGTEELKPEWADGPYKTHGRITDFKFTFSGPGVEKFMPELRMSFAGPKGMEKVLEDFLNFAYAQGRASSQGQPDIIKKLREWLRENYNSEMFGWEVLEFFEPDFPKEGKPNKKPSQGQGTPEANSQVLEKCETCGKDSFGPSGSCSSSVHLPWYWKRASEVLEKLKPRIIQALKEINPTCYQCGKLAIFYDGDGDWCCSPECDEKGAGNDPKEFLDRYDKNESVEDARQLIAELES